MKTGLGRSLHSQICLRRLRALPCFVLLTNLLVAAQGANFALGPDSAALSGNGNVFLTANVLGTGGTGPMFVAVADFNGDGHPDFVVANGGNNTIGVSLGKGDGTFQTPVVTAVPCNPTWVAAGDFNGDGKPDLAVVAPGCNGPPDVDILLGNGDGTFTIKTTFTSFPLPQTVAVGDFNGDGKLDVAVVTQGSPDAVFILLGNGDGTFKTPISVSLGISSGAFQAVVADFNQDSHQDLAVSDRRGNDVLVLLGNGAGTFQAARSFALPAQGYGIAVGDFNGDGIPDLVATTPADAGVTVLLGAGNGNFTAVNNPATGTPPTANAGVYGVGDRLVAAADFNKDGKQDVITTLDGANAVSVLLGSGDGTLNPQMVFDVAPNAKAVAVADLNGDGNPDWVAVTANPVDSATVALGRGDGTFQAARIYTLDTAPVALAFADFNRDGILDMVASNSPSNDVSILLGNSDGTFRAAVNMPFSGIPGGVVTGDFNNDGKQDFVVRDAFGNPTTVAVFLSNGNGTFQAPKRFSTGGVFGGFMVAGDFNGDGKLDLAVSNNDGASPNVAILLGNGDGTFGAPIVTPTGGGSIQWIAAADLNKDGHLDLIVVDTTKNDFAIFLGKGDGTFQAPTTFDRQFANVAAVGDFNNDGNPDLVVTSGDGNGYVYLGNGKGGFNLPLTVTLGSPLPPSGPTWVAVGDFNLDGNLDFVVGEPGLRGVNNGYQGIQLLLGNGNGTFQPVQDYLAGSGNVISQATIGDFNRDGSPDVAIIDTSNFIVVLLNQTPPPTHPLTATLAGSGTGSVTSSPAGISCPSTCTANFGAGVTVILTAKAGANSTFAGWSGACTGIGTCSVVMRAAESVTATFNPVFPLTVTLAGTGMGKVTSSPVAISCPSTCSANFNGGTVVTLTAAAATGSTFAGWSGPCSGTGSCSVSMNAAKSVTATFNLSSGPVVTLSPTSLTFSTQAIGTTSPAKTVTLTNTGTASLIITAIAITGTNAGDFSRATTCGTSLAAGASCTISIKFKPTASGARAAALGITDNAAGSPQKVTLSGVGTTAKLSPTSLSFGTVAIGTVSMAKTVTLTNLGTARLTITGIAITGTNAGDFAQTHTCGSSLAAGASCRVSVTFKPTASGTRSAVLSVTDNAAGSPQKVTLSGAGTAAKLSPTSLSFGSVAVGTTSAAKNVTLTNLGTTSLSITAIAITGTNAGDFIQTHSCGSSLAAGASCSIRVKFKPRAKGRRSAALGVTDNAAGSPQKVTLSGTGT